MTIKDATDPGAMAEAYGQVWTFVDEAQQLMSMARLELLSAGVESSDHRCLLMDNMAAHLGTFAQYYRNGMQVYDRLSRLPDGPQPS